MNEIFKNEKKYMIKLMIEKKKIMMKTEKMKDGETIVDLSPGSLEITKRAQITGPSQLMSRPIYSPV